MSIKNKIDQTHTS